MTNKIYLFLFCLLSFSYTAKGQIGHELIPNGGFEEYPPETKQPGDEEEEDEGKAPDYYDPYLKPKYWYFNSSLAYSRTKDAHDGTYAIKLYPNGGSFFSRDKDFNPYHIVVEPGAEYQLTYWYKGSLKRPNITVTVDWYRDLTSIKRDSREKDKVRTSAVQWQKKTMTFKAPAGVNRAGVGLYIENDYESAESGGFVLIDDISFKMTKEGTGTAALEAPSNLTAHPQQREMELSWRPVADTDVQYQVLVDGQPVATTKAVSFIVEGLEPGSSHRFSVKSVKGAEQSKPSDAVTQQTQSMNMGVEEEGRIPYLYWVKEAGTCPRSLPLYYHDLADPNAAIAYQVDGTPVTPVDGKIVFATKGQHILQIEIVETPGRKWEIEYKLMVD